MDYQEYLKIEALLQLQVPQSEGPEHDEPLFIVIHQVYELWFKILLHETDALAKAFRSDDSPRAGACLKRLRTILKTLVSQVDILETMTPLSFSSFRHRLASSSGFQSVQFRQFEFALGWRNKEFLKHHKPGSFGHNLLLEGLKTPSLYDDFLFYLDQRGFTMPKEVLKRDVSVPHVSHVGVEAALLKVYHNDPTAAQLAELMVDIDEGLQEWRYRHVKMVERTIGFKKGTGGSQGAAYLRTTLFLPLFPDLWQIRANM